MQHLHISVFPQVRRKMANELALANMTFCWNSIIDRASWLLLSLTPQLQLAISIILCVSPSHTIYLLFFFC